jgi:GT2 family glycosyltransferase
LWYRVLPKGDGLYRIWARAHAPGRRARQTQRQRSNGFSTLSSLITVVAGPGDWPSRRTVDSVMGQTNPKWEWILIGPDAVIDRAGKSDDRLTSDARVRVLRFPGGGTRADALNAAWRDARGEFAALLDPRDTLSPSALYEMVAALERMPECDLLYSDEDRIARIGSRRRDPQFKPDWSPDLLLARNYVGRLAMVRRRVATTAGGFRNGFDGEEEWDLMLRVSRAARHIGRMAQCLYHRDDKVDDNVEDPAAPPGRSRPGAAVRDHCDQLGLTAAVSEAGGRGRRIVWPVRGHPTVSIVIPNRDAAAVFTKCVDGLLERTAYEHRQLVIVDNGSVDPDVLSLYQSIEDGGRGVIVPFDRPFNFSAACNAGAAAASGDLLLFLNNDIEVIDADWLDELVRWAQRPDIGVVGAKLLYPDGTIQHAGVAFGIGFVGHMFCSAHEGDSGLFGSTDCYRNYLAVTGACQMMRREVFDRLGGYDERFHLSFSDIVLCMEAWRSGYRVVYTPHARLVHHESYTRKRADRPEDLLRLVEYLEDRGFVEDRYFHPELNPKSAIPALRPPFGPSPKQAVRDYMDRVLAAAAAVKR